MIEKGTESSFSKITCLVLAHLVTDLYPAFLAPLLPLLIDQFKISLTSASLLVTVLVLSTSLTQPLFGFLFDRLGGRRIMIFGPAMGGLSISLIGIVPHYSFLIVLLAVGGLGIASFHPEAAALAARLGGQRRTWGMSLFMLGGNLGQSLGPFLILTVVMGLGFRWSFLTSLPALGMAWILYRSVPFYERTPRAYAPSNIPVEPGLDRRILKFGILLSVVVLRVTTVLSLTAFLPMVQRHRGFSLMAAGGSNTIFIACGAIGG
jgi:FSR family fosmidomycin resistance protein-like MFS transporter